MIYSWILSQKLLFWITILAYATETRTELSCQDVMNQNYINTLDDTDMHQLLISEYLNDFQSNENNISKDIDLHSINTIDYHQSEQSSHIDHEEIISGNNDFTDIIEMSVSQANSYVAETDDVIDINAGVLQHFRRDSNGGLHLFREIHIEDGAMIIQVFSCLP